MAKLKLNNVEVITESGGTATLAPGINPEGTAIKSTGESGGSKFLREDGDGTSSWVAIEPGAPSITDNGNANAITIAADESVTFNQFAQIPSLKPKSNQNLTGTYADHEMIMGDKFTLTGNLTINDNLVLASLSGSGQDIIIEDDGNGRTITTAGKVISCTTTNTDATVTTADTSDLRAGTGVTGTGVPAGATIASVTNATTFELSAAATASGTVNLTFDTGVFEAGEFLGTAGLPSLTDLTGELKTTVTGSPALNLGNTTGTIPSAVTFPAGMVIQVVDSKKTDTSVVQSTTFTDIGGTDQDGSGSVWCCKITPKASSSKIACHFGVVWAKNNGNLSATLRILRGSTVIMAGDADGSRPQAWLGSYGNGSHWSDAAGISFLDTPNTTAEVTYKVQFRSEGGSYKTWINRFEGDYNATANGWRGASAILLMEIAG